MDNKSYAQRAGKEILMITFDEAYKIADESGSESAFNRGELVAVYDSLIKLDKNAHVVEIGVQFGRSATFIGALAKEIGFTFDAYDNWEEDVSSEARQNLQEKMLKYSLPIRLHDVDSVEGALHYPVEQQIDFLHIDGDHSYFGVSDDCFNWLPKVKKGGIVAFDDYGHASLPDVFKAVTEYMSRKGGWEYLGTFGEKLGMFRKI